jgi:VanZ family protein
VSRVAGADARAVMAHPLNYWPVTVVSRLAPPLALMGLIFLLSAQPDLNSGLGTLDTILRKTAHMMEFGLLWFLWWRAFGYGKLRATVTAAVIAILYAATDEWHQSFVAGRVGSPWDWAIDVAGVGVAVLLAHRLRQDRYSQPRSVA